MLVTFVVLIAVMIVVAIVGTFTMIAILPVTTLLWAGYAIGLGIGAIGLAGIAWPAISIHRMQRRLMAHAPHVCLNCAYPLTPNPTSGPVPTPPICPECGHLANTQDLNAGWKRNLGLAE
jgi:hypothetical protein